MANGNRRANARTTDARTGRANRTSRTQSLLVARPLEPLARTVRLFAQSARDVANEAGAAAADAPDRRALAALGDVLYEAVADGVAAWWEVAHALSAKPTEPLAEPLGDVGGESRCVLCDELLTERDVLGLCRHCGHELESMYDEWLR